MIQRSNRWIDVWPEQNHGSMDPCSGWLEVTNGWVGKESMAHGVNERIQRSPVAQRV